VCSNLMCFFNHIKFFLFLISVYMMCAREIVGGGVGIYIFF
jgi:hypothetical protein